MGSGQIEKRFFHVWSIQKTLHRIQPLLQQPGEQNFGQGQSRLMITNGDDFFFFELPGPGGLQSPDQHLGVALQLFLGKHGASLFIPLEIDECSTSRSAVNTSESHRRLRASHGCEY